MHNSAGMQLTVCKLRKCVPNKFKWKFKKKKEEKGKKKKMGSLKALIE